MSSIDRSLTGGWLRPASQSAGTPAPTPYQASVALPMPGTPAVARQKRTEPDLTWPFLVVLLYLLVDFARPQSWFPVLGMLRPGVLALGGGLLTLFFRRDLLYFPLRAKLMLVFLVLMAIGSPFAANRYWAAIQTKDFALFLFGAVIPLMSFVNTYGRVRRLVTFMIVIHVVLALYGITHNGFGIGSFLGDENDFSLALNVLVPYIFFSFYFVRGWHARAALLLSLGLLLFAVTSTNSRGGFIGLLAIGAYCWIASPKKIAALMVLVVVSVPVFVLVPDTYWAEMQTIETSTDADDTGAQRLYFWNVAWEMFKDHPIAGVGPSNYRWNATFYQSEGQMARGVHLWGRVAHSLYYTLLSEYGVLGLALFIALVALGVRDNRRVRQAYRVLKGAGDVPPERLHELYVLTILTRANDASLVAFLVTGAFLSVFYYPHFWLQAALGVALRRAAASVISENMRLAAPGAEPIRSTDRGRFGVQVPRSRHELAGA